MHLILIRHGEPDIEADDLSDPPLTPLGELQAASTAAYLSSTEIDAIYVSPQLRAQQTCRPLALHHGIEATTDIRIAEWDFEHGSYVPSWADEPMTREEATARFEAMRTPEFFTRVRAGFDDIIANNAGRTVAVVCHGGVIGVVVGDALEAGKSWITPNHASVTRMAANRAGTRTLLTFNEHHWVPSAS